MILESMKGSREWTTLTKACVLPAYRLFGPLQDRLYTSDSRLDDVFLPEILVGSESSEGKGSWNDG